MQSDTFSNTDTMVAPIGWQCSGERIWVMNFAAEGAERMTDGNRWSLVYTKQNAAELGELSPLRPGKQVRLKSRNKAQR
jgi:hypothetical protein